MCCFLQKARNSGKSQDSNDVDKTDTPVPVEGEAKRGGVNVKTDRGTASSCGEVEMPILLEMLALL